MPVLTKPAQLQELTTSCVREYLVTNEAVTKQGDSTRAYEEAIVHLIDDNTWQYESVKAVFDPLIEEYETAFDLAYAAYFALCTYYRRFGLKQDLNLLLNSPKPGFADKVSYGFMVLMCKKMLDANDWSLIDEADRLCDPEVMGYNYGVPHCFAEYVADACENNEARVSYYIKEYMQKALARVNDAIKQSNGYPKFYITRARLLNIKALYGEPENRASYFSQVQHDVSLAVSKEKDQKKQVTYQLLGVQMQSKYYERSLSQSLKRQEETIDAQIKENNVKNLEFLSFFSGIMGLLIAGTQLMMGLKFAEGATLLVALTGCLITAFGAIGFVLHSGWKRIVVNVVIVLIGLALTVFAMLYGGRYAL